MKSVYTGGEKVAEFESYDELRVGDGKPAFIYEGNELVYPNPVKDGLVLWYDFSGRTNTDGQRGIAEDLSGNGNHGTLQNFNFTPESGYDKNKLLFDGVDDVLNAKNLSTPPATMTMSVVVKLGDILSVDAITWHTDIVLRIAKNSGVTFIDKRRNNDRFTARYQSSETGLDIIHVAAVSSDTKNEVYINGVKHGELIEPINDLNVNKPLRWGSYGTTYVGFELYSSKIYNRPLTPEEIAHNYAIEKERFGIE